MLSTTTRLIYERSVVERAIGETGQCPVTGEALAADSLVPVRVPTVRTPHPASGTTGVIRILSKEWDDLTLEVFGLRQQLDQTRRELATALYQHDAACRVVARLLRERDEAVNLLTQGGVRMEIDSEAQEPQEEDLGTMPGQLLEELNGACAELSGARKHRKISEEVVRKEVLGAWGANGTRLVSLLLCDCACCLCAECAAALCPECVTVVLCLWDCPFGSVGAGGADMGVVGVLL